MELFTVFFDLFMALFSLNLCVLLCATAIGLGIVMLIKKVVYF